MKKIKYIKTIYAVFFSFFTLLSCSKPINDKDLIGTWKTKDGKYIVLHSDHTFVGNNVDSDDKIKKGEWEVQIYYSGNQKVLKINVGQSYQTLFFEKSLFGLGKSIKVIKWIGDPDDYIRDEYEKVD